MRRSSSKKIPNQQNPELFSLSSPQFWRKQFIVFSLILFAIIAMTWFLMSQLRPAYESSKTDMKKLPESLKKQQEAIATPSSSFRIPILMYHYVEYVQDKKDKIRQSLNINPNIFEQQIITLKNAGYTFMTMSDVADVLDGKAQLPQNPIVLTFDDGHWDLYTSVLPILEKYHVKATAYIISGFIGGSDNVSQDQLEKVIQSGLVEIGAHTVHHIALANKLYPVVQFEVDNSKEQLEQSYHIHVVSFAYPSGSFDQQAADIVRKDGFRTAVSTIPGIMQNQTNRFYLYRIRPGYRVGNELLQFLAQDAFRPW